MVIDNQMHSFGTFYFIPLSWGSNRSTNTDNRPKTLGEQPDSMLKTLCFYMNKNSMKAHNPMFF